jgi:hypothetical protein
VVTHGERSAPAGGGGATRRFRWRRRPAPAPPSPVQADSTDLHCVIVVESADFVCCSYKGCGTLRPLADAVANRACAGCGRV